MKVQKTRFVATIATACALSVLSAAAFAARSGERVASPIRAGGANNAAMSSRPTTVNSSRPMTHGVAKSPMAAHTTGQPNASCEDTPNQPGHSISAPGSAFNPDGVAGTHYAGQQPQNSKNPNSVSQYDVACTRPAH